MQNLKYILWIYDTISGLKVNLAKSSMAGIGIDRQLCELTEGFGCKVEEWPLKYLGLSLGGNPKSTSFWDLVMERVHKKTTCWKKGCVIGWKNHIDQGCDA